MHWLCIEKWIYIYTFVYMHAYMLLLFWKVIGIVWDSLKLPVHLLYEWRIPQNMLLILCKVIYTHVIFLIIQYYAHRKIKQNNKKWLFITWSTICVAYGSSESLGDLMNKEYKLYVTYVCTYVTVIINFTKYITCTEN